MSELSFPAAGAVAVVDVPDGLSLSDRGRLVRSAINAVVAQLALDETITSPGAYARGVVGRGVEAWRAGTWRDWAREHAEEEQRLERLSPDPSTPDLPALLPLLLDGHDFADPRLPDWTRDVLGHAIGTHESDCFPCAHASEARWYPLLRQLGVQPRSLGNYWWSLHIGGFADPSLAVVPKRPGDDEYLF